MTKSTDDASATGDLGLKLVERMGQMTIDRIGADALANAEYNHQYLNSGRSIAELHRAQCGRGDHAVIVAAGPSVKRRDPLRALKDYRYDGTIVTSESALYYCLRNNVIPSLAVTVDPHATRIVRWLGDPSLTEEVLARDDYYRRQDQDDKFADELRSNRELIALLNERGPEIKIAVCTSASRKVVERILEARMQIYWWNPIMDDPDLPNSVTRELQARNGLPCVNAGGNVGTAAWMLTASVLEKQNVALTGVDFSYYTGTPYLNTQYYWDAVNLVGEAELDRIYMRVFNPYLKTWFFTDPAYMWYRNVFLEMAKDSASKTFNCTEGGILFGEAIDFRPLASFLEAMSYKRGSSQD
jgi:hypothetical protein